jgi:hypothetical protein
VDLTAIGEEVVVASSRTWRRSGCAVWTRQWSGRRSVHRRGGCGGGAGARRGPDSG